jgi:hypothetical protein
MSLSAPLPIEVWENVLDHLHSDINTLKKCILVCNSWVPRCRFHLFARITVGKYAARHVQGLLLNNPQFGKYIQHVLLIASRIAGTQKFDRLLDALAPLPNVTYLWITDLDFQQNRAHYKSFVDGFQAVETLVLQSVIFNGPNEEATFVRSFPNLKKIKAFGRSRSGGLSEPLGVVIPHLQHLRIDIGELLSSPAAVRGANY